MGKLVQYPWPRNKRSDERTSRTGGGRENRSPWRRDKNGGRTVTWRKNIREQSSGRILTWRPRQCEQLHQRRNARDTQVLPRKNDRYENIFIEKPDKKRYSSRNYWTQKIYRKQQSGRCFLCGQAKRNDQRKQTNAEKRDRLYRSSCHWTDERGTRKKLQQTDSGSQYF